MFNNKSDIITMADVDYSAKLFFITAFRLQSKITFLLVLEIFFSHDLQNESNG